MNTIKVRGGLPGMANEKLAAAGIFTTVCHGKYAPVVVLLVCTCFALNAVAWPTCPSSIGATTLYHKVGYYPVKLQAVVITA